MSFNHKRIIIIATGILLGILLFVFAERLIQTKIGIAFLALSIIAYTVLCLVWWRCPHCKSYLNKLSPFANYCPFCGKKFE